MASKTLSLEAGRPVRPITAALTSGAIQPPNPRLRERASRLAEIAFLALRAYEAAGIRQQRLAGGYQGLAKGAFLLHRQ